MNPTSVDVRDMLVAQAGLDLVFGVNLFIGQQPSKPDNCVTILDTVIGEPQTTMKRTEIWYSDSIEILVRSTDYLQGEAFCRQLMSALHTRTNEVWNAMRYMYIKVVNIPYLVEWDEKNRANFVLNLNLQKRKE